MSSTDLKGKRGLTVPGLDQKTDKEKDEKPLGEKLQKVLAEAGYGSRREIERQIEQGLIAVNGLKAQLGLRVFPGDKIIYLGKKFTVPETIAKPVRIIVYNKPEGEICSVRDPKGRPTVYDRLPSLRDGRWISVGRLDFNTSGLLLFTDHGELANLLMHPSSEIDREYLIRLQGKVSEDTIQILRDGVMLEDGVAKFTDIVERRSASSNKWYYCALMEGRKREVRRLWESQGLRVSRLKRVRFGPMFLPSFLRAGQWVELEPREVRDLCDHVGLQAPKPGRFKPKERERRERHLKKLKSSKKKFRSASKDGGYRR